MVPTCEIRIDLDDVMPPIWRTLLVPADIGLDHLHYIVQTAMGWTNSHLHEFRKGKDRYGPPNPDDQDFGEPAEDEGEFCIAELLNRPKAKISYEYDFGDGWSHTITLLRIIPEPCLVPRCLDGARACPPEDCGGPGGYANLLEILADPKDAEYQEMRSWFQSMVPEGHDPEVFPIAEVNEQFAKGLDALVEEYEGAAFGEDDDLIDDGEGEDDGDEKIIRFPPSRN